MQWNLVWEQVFGYLTDLTLRETSVIGYTIQNFFCCASQGVAHQDEPVVKACGWRKKTGCNLFPHPVMFFLQAHDKRQKLLVQGLSEDVGASASRLVVRMLQTCNPLLHEFRNFESLSGGVPKERRFFRRRWRSIFLWGHCPPRLRASCGCTEREKSSS